MNLKKQTSSLFRMISLLLAGLVLFVQFHNNAHAFEHGFALEPEQTCEHCLAGHDSEASLGLLVNPEPLALSQFQIEQITQLIFKSHTLSFNYFQSRAPPLS